jgi:hypothetical protein
MIAAGAHVSEGRLDGWSFETCADEVHVFCDTTGIAKGRAAFLHTGSARTLGAKCSRA